MNKISMIPLVIVTSLMFAQAETGDTAVSAEPVRVRAVDMRNMQVSGKGVPAVGAVARPVQGMNRPPQVTTGDKALDEEIKKLEKEMQDKIMAIQKEYTEKIKAIVGNRIVSVVKESNITDPATGKQVEMRVMPDGSNGGRGVNPSERNMRMGAGNGNVQQPVAGQGFQSFFKRIFNRE